MAPKNATRDALLLYLRADTEPRPLSKIYEYMWFHSRRKPGAVRMALGRLVKAGLAVRTEAKYYSGIDKLL